MRKLIFVILFLAIGKFVYAVDKINCNIEEAAGISSSNDTKYTSYAKLGSEDDDPRSIIFSDFGFFFELKKIKNQWIYREIDFLSDGKEIDLSGLVKCIESKWDISCQGVGRIFNYRFDSRRFFSVSVLALNFDNKPTDGRWLERHAIVSYGSCFEY